MIKGALFKTARSVPKPLKRDFATVRRFHVKQAAHQIRSATGNKRDFAASATSHAAPSGNKRNFATRATAVAAAAGVAAVATAGVALSAEASSASNSGSGQSDSRLKEGRQRFDAEVKRRAEKREQVLKFFNENNGERFMTQQDFLKALGCGSSSAPHLLAFFGLADTDGSGEISFSEFAAFASTLHSSETDLRLAFEIFDENHDGRISLEEFQRVLAAQHNAHFHPDNKFIERFFGPPNKRRTLDLREFRSLLNSMEDAMADEQFREFDPKNTGSISVEDFLKLVGDHTPAAVRENLFRFAKTRGANKITREEFMAFHSLISDIDRIENAVANDKAPRISPAAFETLFKQATERELSPAAGRMLFSMFAGSDGLIDHDAFIKVVKSRHPLAPTPHVSYVEYIAMSGLAAMVGASCVFPMDKVKTRLQASSEKGNLFSMFRTLVEHEGFFRLYRGLQAQLIGITPEKALKLTSNQFFVRTIAGDSNRELTFNEQAFAGMCTGLVQVSLTNPVEVVKIRMQMQGMQTGEAKSVAAVVRELGFRRLYTGFPATLLRDVPFNMIFFSCSDLFRRRWKQRNGDIGALGVLVANSSAGVMAAALDTPADTIKTRLQAGNGQYKGVIDCARKTWQTEGVNAFLKGLAPRCLIIGPLFGITMMTLSMLQEWWAPLHAVPEKSAQAELAAIRKSRIADLDRKLKEKYGL